jgi:hypothetical protein
MRLMVLLADLPPVGANAMFIRSLITPLLLSTAWPAAVARSLSVTFPALFRPALLAWMRDFTVADFDPPVPIVGLSCVALTVPRPEIATTRAHVLDAAAYFGVWLTVNALLGAGFPASRLHLIGSKYDGVVELAGTTMNEPLTPAVVVTFATAEPGSIGLDVSQAPVVLAGRFEVDSVPVVPGMLTFVTRLFAPNANPNCCGAPDGIVTFSV